MSYFGTRSYLRENFDTKTFIPPIDNSINRWTGTPPAEKDVDVSGFQWKKAHRRTVQDEGDMGRQDRSIPILSTGDLERPFFEGPIDNLDGYETSIIYQNETDAPLTNEMRSKLMSQYPLDWSGYPPSSAQFQAGLKESFQNATPTVPDDAKPYNNISGSNMSPPDTGSVEAEERKILMTYQPKFPPGATTYDPEDIKGLVDRVYAAKGLKPEIRRRGDTNVYDIINTRKIGDDVKMEPEPVAAGDQAPASADAVPESGEGTASSKAPYAVDQDPFFDDSKADGESNKWDYSAWTPGLERAFAPTNPIKNWW